MHIQNPEFRAGLVVDKRVFSVPTLYQVSWAIGGTGWFHPRRLRALRMEEAPRAPG